MKGVRQQLHDLNSRLASGQIDTEKWADQFDKILHDGHIQALKLGYERAGNFDHDGQDLHLLARGIKDLENEFLEGFKKDIENGRYTDADGSLKVGSLNTRSSLYVGKMRGSANQAFVEGSPDGSVFVWELGGAEHHCGDCPRIEAESPFTADTIISYPGDGETACLGQCSCTLVREDGVSGFARIDPPGDDEDVTQLDEAE